MFATSRSIRAMVIVLALAVPASAALGRTWTSRNGKFSVDATLVDFKDGKVTLKKTDGSEIHVPLAQFCDADQQFVKEQLSPGEDTSIGGNAEQREWSSRDGKFKIKARLLDYRQGKVRLQKADGKEIEVPISRLSDDDRRWVSEQMRRRRSADKADDEADKPEEDEKEDDEATGPATGDEKPITESLGARTVEMKLVPLKLPTGRKKQVDPLTEQLLAMTNAQRYSMPTSGGKNPYEEPFRKLVKKEPEYTLKEPCRAVARFGSKQHALAFDAVGKKPKGYNRLYFDANGNGDLTDDSPIDTKDVEGEGPATGVQSQFRNVEVPMEIEGVKVTHTCCVNVQCLPVGKTGYTLISITPTVVREGQIDLGGRKIRLLLVDHNSNGRFDDRVSIAKRGSQLSPMVGDVFLVNPNTRRRPRGTSPDYYFVNRSVCIGNHFYKMDVTPTGDRLKLEPVELAVGYVTSASPAYRAVVYHDDYGVLMIGGTQGQKVALPEGEWKLANYVINGMTVGRPTTVSAEFAGDAQPVSVKKGSTAELPLGPPFHAVVTATRVGPTKVGLSLSILGKGGERCTDFYVKGKRPPNPTFEVVDKDGKVVHSGKFEYG